MLGLSIVVKLGLLFVTSVAFNSSLKVVVLALRADPPAIRKIKLLLLRVLRVTAQLFLALLLEIQKWELILARGVAILTLFIEIC